MAGYSETPLIKKLGLKPGVRVTFINAPEGWREELGELPNGVKIIGVQKPLDFVLFFPKSLDDLENKFPKLAEKLAPTGMIWIAWPKKSSGVATELAFDVVQPVGLNLGLVDTKICAINEIYSALRFVVRVENRPSQ